MEVEGRKELMDVAVRMMALGQAQGPEGDITLVLNEQEAASVFAALVCQYERLGYE